MTMRGATADMQADRRQDLVAFCLVVTCLGGAFAVAASVQSSLVLGAQSVWLRGSDAAPVVELVLRVVVNLVTVLLVLAVGLLLRVVDRPVRSWPARVVATALVAIAARTGMQLAVGLYTPGRLAPALSDALVTGLMALVILGVACGAVLLQRRTRRAERARVRQAAQAAEALAAVQEDELRMRRRIADGLHGSVQNQLVLIDARLGAVEASVPVDQRAELERVRRELDRLRQDEIRALSSAALPEGIDRGAVAAIRAMLARVPDPIAVEFRVDDRARAAEGVEGSALTDNARLLLVRAAEEALTNALRHGRATRLEVAVTAEDGWIALRFDDDGIGMDPAATLSGLGRLRERFARSGGALEVVGRPAGGVSLSARLPAPRSTGPQADAVARATR